MDALARNYTNLLISENLIPADEGDIYNYGVQVLFTTFSTLLLSLVLGALTGFLSETILFAVAFFPTKSSCGGFHASTPSRCIFASILAVGIAVASGTMPLTMPIVLVVLALGLGLIAWLAPVIHPNHPHSATRVLALRRRARVVGVATSSLVVLASLLCLSSATTMAVAYLISCLGMPLSLLIGQATLSPPQT